MDSVGAEHPNCYLGAENWPRLTGPLGRDKAVESRIAALIGQMSVEEKVGQIIQAEIQYTTPEDVRDYHLGSVLNGGGSLPNRNKYATPADWLAMADAYYEASMDTSDGGVAIPIIWGSDAVHGHNNVIGATIFPHNVGLGAARDPALVREIGRLTAREVRVTGVDWTFAPTVAVARDIRWGRSYESFGEDPGLVQAYAGQIVEGLQGEPGAAEFLDADHVVATAKHFIGDGGTRNGDDQGDALISEVELRDVHGPGYFAALESGVQTVMASFSSWNGEKMHGHRYLLTEVLKNRMGFDGVVVGDWNGHGQIPGCTSVSCPDAINAGLDLFMAVEDWKELYANTLEHVRSGQIPEARLDDAVSRILRVKMRAGLFSKGKPSTRGIAGSADVIGSAEHRAVAREAVRKSLVLLKNENALLPLSPALDVLVAGDCADSMCRQTGGWTITWQGTDNDNSDFPGGATVLQGIRDVVEQAGGRVAHSPEGVFENRPDVAVVVFGEEPYAEFQGDLDPLEFEPGAKSSLALLRKFESQGIPVVSVFLSGRPMWVNSEINASDAFLAAWLPGSEGGGIAEVLFSDTQGNVVHDFVGRLSFSWPAHPLQGGSQSDQQDYDPLFALGYGLSYAGGDAGPGALPENIEGIVSGERADVTIYRGRPLAPWSVFVEGDRSVASIMSGPYARHVTGQIEVRTTDMEMQEDALKVSFSGEGKAALIIDGSTMDLQRFYERGELQFFVKLDEQPAGEIELGFNGRSVPLDPMLEGGDPGAWQAASVAVSRFADSASDLQAVSQLFRLATADTMQISVGKIRLCGASAPP